MRLHDISLKTKLLVTNTLMVLIPICVLLSIGAALLGGLRHTGTLQQQALALLWPERGASLSVQFALSSLRAAAEKKKPGLQHIESDIHILEDAGVQLYAVQKEEHYLTPGASAAEIERMVQRKCGAFGSVLVWDTEGLFFRYEGMRNKSVIMGAGAVPLMGSGAEPSVSREMREHILTLVLLLLILTASTGILLLGRYLARLLSAQILTPLAQMRTAAAAIRRGDLSHTLPPMGSDEVGATCRAFDEMRSALAQARTREQEEETRRRELFIGVLHDIATPLTAIKGYASGLLDGIARTPEMQRTYAVRITRAAATMERLTLRLREFLRLAADDLPLAWETVRARDFLSASVAEHAPLLSEQGILLSLDAGGADAAVRIDSGEFTRVLENLWENSSKYRRAAAVRIQMSLAIEEEHLVIRCDDDGAGVRDEELPKLFDSFYRTDAARSNVADGSGLGLAIVRRIMAALGGSVHAEQSPLGGLRIVLSLPLVTGGDAE